MNFEKQPKVVGIGEILWDMLPDRKTLGGATTNFAFHVHQLGARSFIVSSVGNDAPGKEILGKLRELNLSTGYIALNKGSETGIVQVKLENGIPEFAIKEGVAWDCIAWNTALKKLAASCDAVCFGSLAQRSEISRATIRGFLKCTKPGCLRVCDINLRQHFYNAEIIESSMQLASVLKLNNEELTVVAELFSFAGSERVVLGKLMDLFELTMVALTKGNKGSLLKTKKEESFLKVPGVEVKDTVGAGDSFTAAMVLGMLNQRPLREIHQAANETAAYVCSQEGATPILPERLISKIKQNIPSGQ
jgi:fructokinase